MFSFNFYIIGYHLKRKPVFKGKLTDLIDANTRH